MAIGDDKAATAIAGPFCGTPRPLQGDGRLSAIYKQAAPSPLRLTTTGFEEDVQADRKVHGGAERALCHYPIEHYDHWREVFPEQASEFVAGSFGENIATRGWTEKNVAIGDIFRLGGAVVQVCQPRWPCWKLGQRFDIEALPRRVVETGRSGWLYRVLESGMVEPGGKLERLERDPRGVSLAQLWSIQDEARPPLAALEQLVALEVLASAWRERFSKRLAWLRANT